MLLTTDKQTLTRKIKDIYYAYEMSKTLTKNQILEAYLNNFFVGRGLAGVQAGANGYFSKMQMILHLQNVHYLQELQKTHQVMPLM